MNLLEIAVEIDGTKLEMKNMISFTTGLDIL